MTEEGQIYLCEICGNKVEILESGAGTLVCCGQDMILIE
ncbi:MAG: desulfoferrodoxin FeS4 iron-binding domain-containing protein [Candidatus Bathyarchaeota archaeon]